MTKPRRHEWTRRSLQLGLLTGFGLAFAVGGHQDPAAAGPMPDCPEEGECTFKKPNVLFIMDYSTSMNTVWDERAELTRWDLTVAAVQQVVAPGSFLSQNTHVALMRFGHDPDPDSPDTAIPGDASGLRDGYALDVAWDDDADAYFPCNGQAVVDALANTPPPLDGELTGIGTWTNGALLAAAAEIAQTKADHPSDQDDPARAYVNVILTDGEWTDVIGTPPLMPPSQNPAITAADLYDNQGIPTYVVAVAGDPAAEAAADETAAAGGTGAALDGATPQDLQAALQMVVQTIIDSVVAPECVGGLPRIMILLDASSSMLNINSGTLAGPEGATGWDQARAALAGDSSLFDVDVGVGAAEDVTHLGLAVFGSDEPDLAGVEGPGIGAGKGEARLLVQYGPCMKDNFGWALDPEVACADGCGDPWGGPPITWTFADGQAEPPGFDLPTRNHMPQCGGGGLFCSGSGTFTHLGLQLIKQNQIDYLAAASAPMAEFPANEQTLFFNILITDGQYDTYSTDAQVQAELEQMHAGGITTYVIGFGDGLGQPAAIDQLTSMAAWGSGGTQTYFDAATQGQLESALASIFAGLEFDACCAFNDCSQNPEPTTNEPDPPPTTSEDEGETGEAETGEETETGGDSLGEGDSGTGGGGGDAGGSAGDLGADLGDDGCNCSSAEDPRGAAMSLALLGMLGLLRRRRRATS